MCCSSLRLAWFLTVLDKANFLGVATEALPATHETILPDQPMRVSANPAGTRTRAIALRMRVPYVCMTNLSLQTDTRREIEREREKQ